MKHKSDVLLIHSIVILFQSNLLNYRQQQNTVLVFTKRIAYEFPFMGKFVTKVCKLDLEPLMNKKKATM